MAKKDGEAKDVGMTAEEAAKQPVEEKEAEEAEKDAEAGALKSVRNYMYGSMAVGLIPAPVIDLAGLGALQLKMIHSIAEDYGVPFKQDLGKSILSSLLGALGPVTLATGTFGSIVKAIPVVGPLAGIVTQPLLAGAFTYAVGKVFIQHFELGGTLLDFDAKKMKEYFALQFEEGKLVAGEMADEQPKDAGK